MRLLPLSIICALLLIARPAIAQRSSWDRTSLAALGSSVALLFVDCGQTHVVASLPGHAETNPILGPHPSHANINWYFASAAAAEIGVAAILPPPWRKRFLFAVTLVEGVVVTRNFIRGISVRF